MGRLKRRGSPPRGRGARTVGVHPVIEKDGEGVEGAVLDCYVEGVLEDPGGKRVADPPPGGVVSAAARSTTVRPCSCHVAILVYAIIELKNEINI